MKAPLLILSTTLPGMVGKEVASEIAVGLVGVGAKCWDSSARGSRCDEPLAIENSGNVPAAAANAPDTGGPSVAAEVGEPPNPRPLDPAIKARQRGGGGKGG